ncbi:ABC1 kinase family protein [Nocardia acididurans]|uniref:ABC1 kinase family protein n=1 Tax=Nocardia acididurans TaxID=2802282 RepID=UPI0027DD3348|nr:AarF/ABC1/UbiB kinase family protein [Nocardia acididurans]
MRNAKLATLPVAYAGRRAAGVGKRAMGRPPAEVQREIQQRTAQHIFEVLGELRGCVTKLGQLLSIYELALPDGTGEPYRIALRQLQDSTPAMLPPTVHAAMAASLGPDWRSQFREFDDRSAASASIGQVHRAVWQDGRAVAVKIMYPGARAAVHGDLQQLRRISVLATVFIPGADVHSLTDGISASIEQELDYLAEARHQRTFAAAFADDPDFLVPEVITQCGDVIVSEWVDGISMPRLITSGTQAQRDRAGLLALRFVIAGWQRAGLLYADPHPGNFRLLPDGRLGVVDFGACTPWPPAEFLAWLGDLAEAVFNGGVPALERVIRDHGFVAPGRDIDVEAAAEMLAPLLEPLQYSTFRMSTEWLGGIVREATSPRLTNVTRQLTVPGYYTPFGRALLTALGTLCQLGTGGALKAEFARASPEMAAAMVAFDRRETAHLAIARAESTPAPPQSRRLRVVGD